MNSRPKADDRDTFEDFHHEEVFALEMEIRHVLDGAGPEAVAAMPEVEKVRRVWRLSTPVPGNSPRSRQDYHVEELGLHRLSNTNTGMVPASLGSVFMPTYSSARSGGFSRARRAA